MRLTNSIEYKWDIARKSCQSVATVLKVFPNSQYSANLVNIFILGKTENEKQLDN